ncbi:DUF5984 family protein [Halocola ammonii]
MIINFQLKNPDQINPAGTSANQHLSWYLLTDGDLWLNLGDRVFYEYSKESVAYLGGKNSPYNDYYIARFIEDFIDLFENIQEEIPEGFFELTNDLRKFQSDANQWWDMRGIDDDKAFEDYETLTSWIKLRTLSSKHLKGGPDISFFRRDEKMRILWNSDYVLENGINLWSSDGGRYDMNYFEFVEEVRQFGQDFFSKMEKQVEFALKKDWHDVEIDKQRLVEEHRMRKDDFHSALNYLVKNGANRTNWKEVGALLDKMKGDLERK